MSYPPRPPGPMSAMPPGMPVPPYMTGPMMPMPPGMPPGAMMMGYPPMGPPMMGGGVPPGMAGMPGMPGVMSQMQGQGATATTQMTQGPRTQTPAGTVQQTPTVISRGPKLATDGVGPSITVFVGNITDRAPDNMIRQMLAHCGAIVSWKRVQGASGVLQAFGFCEYSNPEAALRSIRLLHDLEIGDKKLVVKVDAKTKLILDNYKAEKIKTAGASSTDDDFLTQEQKVQDKWVREKLGQTLKDYESEMQANQARAEEKERREHEKEKARAAKKEDSSTDLNKFENDIEDGKKDLITREIGKFREIAKKQDEEKEAERKKRNEREKERERRDRDRNRERDQTRNRDRERERERDRSERDRDRERERERDRDRDGRDRERTRDRDRDRRRDKETESHRRSRTPPRRSRTPSGPPPVPSTPPRRSRSRDRPEPEARPPRRTEKDYQREKEEEEEAIERKKAEKRAREKEVAYQERLRHWEGRERKRQREYEKIEQKEKERMEEQQKHALWLKQFLEDYDDERDDPKYYKGREMERRRTEREREMESDARDRQKEKEELEELKNKIFSEGHSDPNATLKQALYEREQQYKPQILVPGPPIVSETSRTSYSPMDVSLPSQPSDTEEFPLTKDTNSRTSFSSSPSTPTGGETKTNTMSATNSVIDLEDNTSMTSMSLSPVPTESDSKQSSQGPSLVFNKRKKLEIKAQAVFNIDEDEAAVPKKRKLVPLDYGDEVKKEKEPKPNPEEKRKNIKSLIEKIPTDKDSLFAYPVEWSLVDNIIVERRIKPWVNKKIVEYIGEPEPTLVDFICSKVLSGSQPLNIINDVQMVLDEEAEVFVVKMWRLLIYELEAKKLGLVTK